MKSIKPSVATPPSRLSRSLSLAVAIISVASAGAAAAADAAPVVRPSPMAAPMQGSDASPRLIVKLRSGEAVRNRNAARSVTTVVDQALLRAGVTGMQRSAGNTRLLRRLAVGADLLQAPQALSAVQAAAVLVQLRSDPDVQYAQLDTRKYALDVTPDDEHYPYQWHYQHPVSGIGAPQAWDAATGTGVVVAVLDTGYLDHADLAANLVPGYDFIHDPEVGNDGDGRDPDAHDPGDWTPGRASSFHGTHVAGTVAAVTNNGRFTAGVAYNAKVQPVRVLGTGGGYTSDIADAIVWAAGGRVDAVPDNTTPAEVLNLSLGGAGSCADDPVTQAAIDAATARGSTVVVAAGNRNRSASQFSPASCRGVVTVGATGYTGARSSYSNYGPAVDIAAPGGDDVDSDQNNNYIWSLGNNGTQAPEASPAGDRTVGMQGTSMAAPHVAAVVALMQDARATAGLDPLTPLQVRQVLRTTSRPFAVTPPTNRSIGAGIVDAAAAVQAAGEPLPDNPSELLVNRVAATAQSAVAGEPLLYRIEVPAGASMLSLRTYGGNGTAAVYAAHDRVPSAASNDYRSVKPGTAQTVQIIRPAAGTWYMAVIGDTDVEGLSVVGLY
ncbi:S8 family peptidase [Stenotrophomonas sp. C3(2023)]|uniref:S8 family peptidase n=1 Tax=Stenotrophomonas sp. C3(2023) TaxID=3080277 RepID=UPI00293C42B8|nr:S8 family peptidase [Stenotrophomonas sp. C3(2023)]MDV3469358.1 S8 family peptidase [Stenotrophomonas sp. C3(2023)]